MEKFVADNYNSVSFLKFIESAVLSRPDFCIKYYHERCGICSCRRFKRELKKYSDKVILTGLHELLKKEFDICREEQTPHRIFIENNLSHLVPFDHPDMDKWRDSLRNGLMINYENIILTGGVDDIWQDKNTKELIVVDYKSQANSREVEPISYLSSPYHEGYKIQMDFYAYLLTEMGFDVNETAYFLVCNADRSADGFFGKLDFSETLIPYQWNTDWIPSKLDEMMKTLNSDDIPLSNESCENCAYARERSIYDKTS